MKPKSHTYHFHAESGDNNVIMHADGVIATDIDPETGYLKIRALIGDHLNPPLEPESFAVTSFTRLK